MSIAAQSGSLLWVVFAMVAALTTGTLVRLSSLRGLAEELVKSRLDSLRTWWIVAGLVIGVALLGSVAAAIVFTIVSLLALVEFLRIADSKSSTRVRGVTLALVPMSYLLLALGHGDAFLSFLPIGAVIAVGATLVCEQNTKGFLVTSAKHLWGLLVTTYLLGHVVLLFDLPAPHAASGAGWFLLLVLLTEGNDIMQALAGRRFGRRKLAPVVSPNKTWEGALGGAVATVGVALLCGPWLTPLSLSQAALGGLLVAVMGVCGDLNISALKRDAGVKDSGTLLPGQGGVLDRVDSLTFSAPAFYYYATVMVG